MDHRAVFADFLIGDDGFTCVCYRVAERVVPVVVEMLIDGYIIVVDYTEQKKLAAEINKIGVNINTVCRRINSTGRFYQDDIDELKEKMDAVWQLLKSKQSEEL